MDSMVVSIWGPEKTAKTSIALTFPQKIRHFDFDLGFERASYRFQEDIDSGRIVSTTYPAPLQLSIHLNGPLKGYKELWYRFLQDYVEALNDPEVKTIVLDTATQLWQICHMAYLQEKQEAQLPLGPAQKLREKLMPVEYGEPNARMRAVEQATRTVGKGLVMCHYQTAVYGQRLGANGIEEYDTGEKQLDGYKHTANLSDIVLRTRVEKGVPKALVTVCGLSLNLVGVEFENPTYQSILEAVRKIRAI